MHSFMSPTKPAAVPRIRSIKVRQGKNAKSNSSDNDSNQYRRYQLVERPSQAKLPIIGTRRPAPPKQEAPGWLVIIGCHLLLRSRPHRHFRRLLRHRHLPQRHRLHRPRSLPLPQSRQPSHLNRSPILRRFAHQHWAMWVTSTASREAGLCRLAMRQGLWTSEFATSEHSSRLTVQASLQKP